MDNGDSLFRKSVTGVTPLRKQASRNSPDSPSDNKTSPRFSNTTESGNLGLDGDLYYRSGVRKKRLRELRRGKLKINDTLDLHGYTQTSTPIAISNFITSCSYPENQCVMIITGKGKNSPDRVSVVRTIALETLRNHPRVLAYCCSQPADGGYGAFYVLLQR